MRDLKIVFHYAVNAFQMVLNNPAIFILFLISKTIRISLFLLFLYFLVAGLHNIAGFDRSQIIFFYLSFNLIDTVAQLLFREVYRFRPLVITGELDFVLTKPIHPLTRVLLGGPDVIDFSMLFILAGVIIWYAANFIHPTLLATILYILLIVNAIILAAAFHILVLGFAIMTTSIDHLIMIYRDLTSLLRIPVDLYVEPLRSLITFVLPLGIMFTFSAKVLLGLLSWQSVILALLIGIGSIFLALKFWNFSLRHYQSASS